MYLELQWLLKEAAFKTHFGKSFALCGVPPNSFYRRLPSVVAGLEI